MKKIERGTIKHLIILIIFTAIFGIILYPILDFLYYKFITNSKFSYSFLKHVIEPVIFACILGLSFWILDKRKK